MALLQQGKLFLGAGGLAVRTTPTPVKTPRMAFSRLSSVFELG